MSGHLVPEGRDVAVRECPGGPLLVRGAERLVGPDGAEVPVRRRTVALCRCGASALTPFCDGSHRSLAAAGDDALS